MRAGILAAAILLAMSAPAQVEGLRAAARTALGGEARLSAVKTLVIKGTIVVGAGPSKDYGNFTIHVRLPDAFVRFRVMSPVGAAGGAAVGGTINPMGAGGVVSSLDRFATTMGFNGRRLIYEPSVRQERVGDLAPATADQIRALFRDAQREFVELTLGLFAASFDGAPVRLAATRDPNSLSVSGVGQPLTLAFDPISGVPVRVDDLVFEDRRDVAGIKVPFRLVRMAGSAVRETWDVKEFLVDVPIADSVFREPAAR